jgi:hypothetical protein
MSCKRMLLVFLMMSLLLSAAACRQDSPPADNTPKPSEVGDDWKWKHVGFENGSVDKVQVTDDGRIFALVDGKIYFEKQGKWTETQPDTGITAFCLLKNTDEITIVAGTDNGKVYLYSVEADNWSESVVQAVTGPIDIIIAGPSSGEVYIGQSSKNGGGLWKSSDGGISWEKLTDITVRGIAVHPEVPEIMYIVDKLTYLSTDGGINWKKMETGANYGVLIHPLYPDTAYLAYAHGVVTAEHDGSIVSQQQFYLPGGMTRLEFSPVNPSEWALGIWDYPSGIGGLYYTFNGGARWLEMAEEMKDKRILDLCYSEDGRMLYIGTAGDGLWALNIDKLKDK